MLIKAQGSRDCSLLWLLMARGRHRRQMDLEATLSLVQKVDVAGSQRLLLGSTTEAAAAQMAVDETSAPLPR